MREIKVAWFWFQVEQNEKNHLMLISLACEAIFESVITMPFLHKKRQIHEWTVTCTFGAQILARLKVPFINARGWTRNSTRIPLNQQLFPCPFPIPGWHFAKLTSHLVGHFFSSGKRYNRPQVVFSHSPAKISWWWAKTWMVRKFLSDCFPLAISNFPYVISFNSNWFFHYFATQNSCINYLTRKKTSVIFRSRFLHIFAKRRPRNPAVF